MPGCGTTCRAPPTGASRSSTSTRKAWPRSAAGPGAATGWRRSPTNCSRCSGRRWSATTSCSPSPTRAPAWRRWSGSRPTRRRSPWPCSRCAPTSTTTPATPARSKAATPCWATTCPTRAAVGAPASCRRRCSMPRHCRAGGSRSRAGTAMRPTCRCWPAPRRSRAISTTSPTPTAWCARSRWSRRSTAAITNRWRWRCSGSTPAGPGSCRRSRPRAGCRALTTPWPACA